MNGRAEQWRSEFVERAADAQRAAIEYVSVDHSRFDIFVTKQFLHGADVVTGFQQAGGKAVAEGMTTPVLGNLGFA
jgi:hypothetical protein